MLAQNNEAMNECVDTMAQLSEDEKIRIQCEARKDSIAIEKGLYNRGFRQGQQEGELRGKVIMCKELGLSVEDTFTKIVNSQKGCHFCVSTLLSVPEIIKGGRICYL